MNKAYILKDSVFKVGQVISIDGRNVRVRVDKNKNSSHLLYKGKLLKNISVGSYIKIVKGFTKIIGKVEGEFIEEDKLNLNKKYGNSKDKIQRVLSVSMLGFFDDDNKFKRGIKELPLVYDECFLLEYEEFKKVHDFIKEGDESLKIGYLSEDKGQEINIGVNSLFASHIGIFGNTGSGKSYTLAKLYSELFKEFQESKAFKQNAKFLLIDFNGEYSSDNVITKNKKVYNLTTYKRLENISDDEKIPLKEEDLLDIELISILANATEKTQKPFISRTLQFIKKVNRADNPLDYFKNTLRKHIKNVLMMSNKDKAYMLIDYLTLIINYENRDSLISTIEWNNRNSHFMPRNGQSRALYNHEIKDTDLYRYVNGYEFPNNSISKLIDFLYLQMVYDIYNDKAQQEHISPAINKLKSEQKNIEKVFNTKIDSSNLFPYNKNFVVINLNNVNDIGIKKAIPLLISKKMYSEHKKDYKHDSSLNIIIDEAHNILSDNSNRESETWKDYRLETFEEIIKEGRKFGVFLTIASQRPSDISATIISQLHNYFLHRLINNKDIQAVEKTISYLDKLSFDSLPILPTGSCILAGLSAQVPVVLDIDKIKDGHEPKSETITLLDYWK